MKIIELKCSNCGAKLEKIDKKNAVCNHCGSVFLIKEVQKEQKKTTPTDTGLHNRILAWFALIGIVVGIMGLFAVSAYFRAENSKLNVAGVAVIKEQSQWSPLFQMFLEEVYQLPIEKIDEKQIEEITHLKIYLEKNCRVVEYRMKEGEIKRLEFSEEDHVDYGDAGRLIGLKSLDIGSRDFAEGELTNLKNLTEIWCGNTPEELFTIVNAPERITTMGCYSTSTIAMVDHFENLQHLYIENPGLSEKLTDISALGVLKNLKRLELVDCDAVTDFGVLHSLAGLEELTIDSESLKEISFVEKMDALSRLKIENSIILDVSSLEGKSSLKELTLLDNFEVTDYSGLSSLTELETLELELCSVSDMPDVSQWKKLTSLMVSGAEDIRFLKELKQLEDLYLKGCNCSHYDVLAALEKVETLKLYGIYGEIYSLDVFHKMGALKTLDISGMTLYGNVQSLFGIETLESLNLSECSFGLDFESMPANDNLKYLNMNRMELWENIQVSYSDMVTYLDYDKVMLMDHIGFLDKFPNLEELYVQGMKLTEVTFVKGLPNLRKLDITGNYVTDIRPLSSLQHLEIVWCGENSISQGLDLGENIILITDSKMDKWSW